MMSSYGVDEEDTPFLHEAFDEKHPHIHSITRSPRLQRTNWYFLLGNAVFALLNIIILFYISLSQNVTCHPDFGSQPTTELYSPAYTAIQYETKSLDYHLNRTKFIGEPRQDLTDAWNDLLKPSAMLVTEEEMKTMNKTSVALKSNEGYVGYLEVFHQLHCLKRIYQWEYRDHYQSLEKSGKASLKHWEHCLEVLRQSLMCRPDLTINTIRFDPKDHSKLQGVTSDPRRCVNWNHLKSWADQRSLPLDIHDKLVDDDDDDDVEPA